MSKPIRVVITFLIGCGMFVGIPFFAWGVTDCHEFIDNPARLGYIVAVLVMNAFAAIRIPEVGKKPASQKTTVSRQRLVVTLLQILSILIVVIAPYCDRRGIAVLTDTDGLRETGLALYVLGFMTMHFAEFQLGKQFSVQVAIQEGHTLVTDGLYRYLRHPRYLGIIAFSLGISMVFRSWLALFLSAATILVLMWRIHDEEALMHEEFGADWEAYSRRSWRLIPLVY